MAKYPKLPFGAMSPFERSLREKPLQAEEMKRNERRGCGDPRCPQCYPENGMGDFRYGGSDDREDSFRKLAIEILSSNGKAESQTQDSAAYNTARAAVAEYILEVPPSVDWSNVIGNQAAKDALMEAVEHPITNKALYEFYNMKPLHGCLLWGPPGCGKTMFGKAAASAIAYLHGVKAEMLSINGAALQSPWVGETERKIVAFFTYARLYAKRHGHSLVIFIDEADAILPSRGSGASWQIQNVATFLAEMDGIVESSAFVILATNRPETIDEAILRDGRCDRKIKVERPGFSEGREIIQNQLLFAPLQETLRERGEGLVAKDLMDYIVQPSHTINELQALRGEEKIDINLTLAHIMSGAMLVGLVNRAKIIAFRRDLITTTPSGIAWEDLTAAVDEVIRENKGLPHIYALMEIGEQLNIREAKVKEKVSRRLN